MMRVCSQCHKLFTPPELAREESRGMEAERKALGLQGVLFRYYRCAACGQVDIFIDIHPLPEETDEAFRSRRQELEHVVKELHGDRVDLVLMEK
jgi:DNA-directed RNA polymerase subunit RPC12/RpoP